MEKICSKCKIEKELDKFPKDKKSKDGLGGKCKLCFKNYSKLYKLENRDKIKQYYLNNKEKINIQSKEWIRSNSERFKKTVKEYELNNSEKIKKYRKNYDHIYHKIHRKERNEYNKKKRVNDLEYRIKNNIRNGINQSLKYQNTRKNNSTVKYLGCDIKNFKQYIESQFKPEMNWGNWGIIWEIDHIIPTSTFDLINEEEKYIAFNYKNTQPLFKTTEIAHQFGYLSEIGNRNKSNKWL